MIIGSQRGIEIMLNFNRDWRLDSGNRIVPDGLVDEFFNLIGRVAAQGYRKMVLEHFKGYFARANGTVAYSSSSTSWAESDLRDLMYQARGNAPLFIEALYDACEGFPAEEDIAVPDVALINRTLSKHDCGFEIRPPNLISVDEDAAPIQVNQGSVSLDQQARDLIEDSLREAEKLLTEGRYRQAVQEVLWLLETVSTAFQGMTTNGETVQGKYFNKIIADLRRNQQGTTLSQVTQWIEGLHGYLSSPTGGGIRHGTDLKDGVATRECEARLFCNLVRSYISFLISEHSRLGEH